MTLSLIRTSSADTIYTPASALFDMIEFDTVRLPVEELTYIPYVELPVNVNPSRVTDVLLDTSEAEISVVG